MDTNVQIKSVEEESEQLQVLDTLREEAMSCLSL